LAPGPGRQFHTPTLPVHVEAADTSSTGSGLRRVRTVNGKASQEMFKRWQFHTVHVTCRSFQHQAINKKVSGAILERRNGRGAVKPSAFSSILKVFKNLAGFRAPALPPPPLRPPLNQRSLPRPSDLPNCPGPRLSGTRNAPARPRRLSPSNLSRSSMDSYTTVTVRLAFTYLTLGTALDCVPGMWTAARDY
jgi:hypothetical protein